jgi:probable aminopeptidase NPEPL1
MAANVEFVANLVASDPQKHPVLIVGQTKHLSKLSFKDVRSKLEPRVTEDVCVLTRKQFGQIFLRNSFLTI